MNTQQWRIVRRFEKLVREAKEAGLVVAVDSGAIAIRIFTEDERGDGSDITQLGETVSVHDACGSDQPKFSGDACNSAYS
jgi:hypothetical protein